MALPRVGGAIEGWPLWTQYSAGMEIVLRRHQILLIREYSVRTIYVILCTVFQAVMVSADTSCVRSCPMAVS